jgi:aminomethyltransferase
MDVPMSEAEPPIHPSIASTAAPLRLTPLNALHRELGAKLVPFAGYEMPLQFAAGIVKEHLHVRSAAGLFDVSHMGQARLSGPDFETAAAAFEALVPGDILGLKPGRLRYTQLLNAEGGMIDDLMAARDRDGQGLWLVVNASRREIDFAYISAALPPSVKLTPAPDRALLALQGPKAAGVLARSIPGVEKLRFMESATFRLGPEPVLVSRSGYTGEDGFEISVSASYAESLARRLLAEPEVLAIGLGARDTLRLEAGLCLYGQDMDEAVSPVEAGLSFSIGKRRRAAGGFTGAGRVLPELMEGPKRMRTGLKLEGRAAARTGMAVTDPAGNAIGRVTSGAFTPSAAASIAMAYVPASYAAPGTEVAISIRGAPVLARTVPMPFVPHNYVRPA